jgi:hypothetical protein
MRTLAGEVVSQKAVWASVRVGDVALRWVSEPPPAHPRASAETPAVVPALSVADASEANRSAWRTG